MMLVGLQDSARATKINGGASKPRQTFDAGFGINYLKETLYVLQTEMRWSDFERKSPYRMKKMTLDMIKWCISRDLISRREEYRSSFKSRKKPQVFYKITDNGRKLLELIQ